MKLFGWFASLWRFPPVSSVCPAGDEGWGRQDYRPPQPPVSPSGDRQVPTSGLRLGRLKEHNMAAAGGEWIGSAQCHIVSEMPNTILYQDWPVPKKKLASTKIKFPPVLKKKPSPHKLGLFSKDQDPKSCHRQTITGNKNWIPCSLGSRGETRRMAMLVSVASVYPRGPPRASTPPSPPPRAWAGIRPKLGPSLLHPVQITALCTFYIGHMTALDCQHLVHTSGDITHMRRHFSIGLEHWNFGSLLHWNIHWIPYMRHIPCHGITHWNHLEREHHHPWASWLQKKITVWL